MVLKETMVTGTTAQQHIYYCCNQSVLINLLNQFGSEIQDTTSLPWGDRTSITSCIYVLSFSAGQKEAQLVVL